jgi:hypothetical protein
MLNDSLRRTRSRSQLGQVCAFLCLLHLLLQALTDYHTALHERVDDTANLERLNPLMEGQTHRAQLMAAMREHGGQPYVTTPKPSGRPARFEFPFDHA